MKTIPFSETEYGFKWGSLEVIRVASDDKRGWVVVNIRIPNHEVSVYATKSGRCSRVYVNGRVANNLERNSK